MAVPWFNLGCLYLSLRELKLANSVFSAAQRIDSEFCPSWVGQVTWVAYLLRFSIDVRKLSQSFLKLLLATIQAIASSFFILVITTLILSCLFKWIGEFLVTFKNLYNFKNRFKNASSIKVKEFYKILTILWANKLKTLLLLKEFLQKVY